MPAGNAARQMESQSSDASDLNLRHVHGRDGERLSACLGSKFYHRTASCCRADAVLCCAVQSSCGCPWSVRLTVGPSVGPSQLQAALHVLRSHATCVSRCYALCPSLSLYLSISHTQIHFLTHSLCLTPLAALPALTATQSWSCKRPWQGSRASSTPSPRCCRLRWRRAMGRSESRVSKRPWLP